MISDRLSHTYISQGLKFYAFFETFDVEVNEKRYKGFNFYIFDAKGYCWCQHVNTTKQFVKQIAEGVFYHRVSWTAEGLAFREPITVKDLDVNSDTNYAIETLRQALGIDILLIHKAKGG